MEKDKTETVYIKSDAEGNTKEITVETTLKHPTDGSDIQDQSNLKDIRNTRGDEEYSAGLRRKPDLGESRCGHFL